MWRMVEDDAEAVQWGTGSMHDRVQSESRSTRRSLSESSLTWVPNVRQPRCERRRFRICPGNSAGGRKSSLAEIPPG